MIGRRKIEITNDEIIELRESGRTYKEIADLFNVSRQRIHQICSKDKEKIPKGLDAGLNALYKLFDLNE
jgi:transcriptional regulator